MLRGIIISDTHIGSIEKLVPSIIDEIKKADFVIHAGDADAYSFISDLKKICKELYAVKGNCDWGSDLPAKLVFTLEGVRIGLSHGSGNHANVLDRLCYIFSDDAVDVVIFGHTHIPFNEDYEGFFLINPGSPSLNRNIVEGSYAVLTLENGTFKSEIRLI